MNKLNEYIEAIHSIHQNDTFWIFDTNWQMIYSNEIKYQLSQFKFYSSQSGAVYTWDSFIESLAAFSWDINITPSIEVIGIISNNLGTKCLLMQILPLHAEDEIIGYFILNLGNVANFEYINLLSHVIFGNYRKTNLPELSPREAEITYFILRGKTYAEIAKLISEIHNKQISESCIGKTVRNSLYYKFNVWNKFELKEYLLKSKYVNKIPPSIYESLKHD